MPPFLGRGFFGCGVLKLEDFMVRGFEWVRMVSMEWGMVRIVVKVAAKKKVESETDPIS